MTYLAICTIYRDNAPYFREWIEFHRLVGVERFFLYNNRSEDDHLEVLRPYIESGLVVWHDWPMYPGHLQSFDHCLEHHRDDARWIAFLDQDEFLFSPTRRPVSELLVDFEQWPGVVVNSLLYGTSGHTSPPPGLVVENYVRRSDNPVRNRNVKSIVDPRRTRCAGRNPHYFRYLEGALPVNENLEEVRGPVTERVSCELFRINHYITRSKMELERKMAGRVSFTGKPKPATGAEKREARLNAAFDDTLPRCYGEALREALGMPARAEAPPPKA